MECRQLGTSGLVVSTACLGSFPFGDACDKDEAIAIVHRALERGVTFIDTADIYGGGLAEEFIGEAITGQRDELVLVTKTGWMGEPGLPPGGGGLSRRRIIQRLEASLRRLRTDYVDVFYAHRWDTATPLEETLRAIDDLIRAGKIRYFGVSNYAAWQLARIVGVAGDLRLSGPILSDVRYNLLWREPETEVFPACDYLGLGVIAHTPLAEGLLTGKHLGGARIEQGTRGYGNERWQSLWLSERNTRLVERYATVASECGRPLSHLAVAWVAAQPLVASVVFGCRSVRQLDENLDAFEWTLDSAVERALSASTPDDLG